jgi:hypothetical protein
MHEVVGGRERREAKKREKNVRSWFSVVVLIAFERRLPMPSSSQFDGVFGLPSIYE